MLQFMGSQRATELNWTEPIATSLEYISLTHTVHLLYILDKEIIQALQWCRKSDFKFQVNPALLIQKL